MGAGFGVRLAKNLEGRVFYGWVIVALVFTSNLVAYSPNPTFGLFVTPLEHEFGWSRSLIAGIQAIGPVTGALLAPLLGWLVERIGLRRMLLAGGIVSGLAYLLLSRVAYVWQFYLLYGLIFGVLFAGCALMTGNVAISRWFRRRRGRAMGIVMMGASSGGVLFIPIQSYFIATLGWRATFGIQGLFPILLISIPAFLLMVNHPGLVGLAGHDEFTGARSPGAAGPPAADESWSVREAVRTRAFWLTLTGVMLGNFVVWGYFGHAVPHMEKLGFSRALASTVWATFFFVGVFAKFAWGFLVERLTVRWSLVLCLAFEAIGLYLLIHAETPTDLFLYAILNGIGHGPYLQLVAQVWADYFGTRSIGAIYGAIQPAFVAAGALGPLAGGVLFDIFGHYRVFFTLSMVATLIGAAIFLVDRPPTRPARAPLPAPGPAGG
ncbi:MAG: MFS transporter [Candidatus Lambdaproteobacteria bacterium]|nr:MFS transporter [Candidatus Lambdaproteobacteria bacterium]